MQLAELVALARSKGASDVHVSAESGAVFRVDGTLERVALEAGAGFGAYLVTRFFNEEQVADLQAAGDVTTASRSETLGALRVHAYRTAPGISFAIRLLASQIPSLDALQLPAVVREFTRRQHGLVLFAGPTGSGKTTALAALVETMNAGGGRHIVTIEDPIEYEHRSRGSMVSQREIGRDAVSFSAALRGALRSDPDVIVLGEMRDCETMQAALTAAETGHLVLATLHTADAPQTVERIVDVFAGAAQDQIRTQLAQTLLGVVCMRLVQAFHGRRAAAEVLIATDAVRNLIRERKTYLLRNVIGTGRQLGMQTLEMHLSELVMRREISLASARACAARPDELRVPVA